VSGDVGDKGDVHVRFVWPADLHARVKASAALAGVSMQAWVLAALSGELDPAAPAPDFQLGRGVVAMLEKGEPKAVPESMMAGPLTRDTVERALAHRDRPVRDFSRAAQAKKVKK
jgi:hypothetical protein